MQGKGFLLNLGGSPASADGQAVFGAVLSIQRSGASSAHVFLKLFLGPAECPTDGYRYLSKGLGKEVGNWVEFVYPQATCKFYLDPVLITPVG